MAARWLRAMSKARSVRRRARLAVRQRSGDRALQFRRHLATQAHGARTHRGTGRLYPHAQTSFARFRHRPGRHRQDLARGRACGLAVRAQGSRSHHPVAAGGGSWRAARLPARRHAREGRSVSAPDLRRAVRPDGPARRRARDGGERDRDRAARLHARTHAAQCGGHSRRGAEYDVDADEDVPDAARREQPHDRDRRSEPGRSAAGPDVRAGRSDATAHRCRGHRSCRASRTKT